MALAKSPDRLGSPFPQLQNENTGLITQAPVITKILWLSKRNKNSQTLERNESKSMTKLYQLDKILIKPSQTCVLVSQGRCSHREPACTDHL